MSALDVRVIDHGTIVTFIPLTEGAKEWFSENLQDGGGRVINADHRPAQEIVYGLEAAGFSLGN